MKMHEKMMKMKKQQQKDRYHEEEVVVIVVVVDELRGKQENQLEDELVSVASQKQAQSPPSRAQPAGLQRADEKAERAEKAGQGAGGEAEHLPSEKGEKVAW